jgi:starch synthase
MRPLRILTVCAEFAPLAKVGGLGDVTAGLTRYLAGRGHDVRVVLPFYAVIDRQRAAPGGIAVMQRSIALAGREIRYAAYCLSQDTAGASVYLIDCPALFGGEVYASGDAEAVRFMVLSQAALELCRTMHFRPDIVHCHDWHAAPAAVLLKGAWRSEPGFRTCYTVLTIHNIGYQGIFPARVLEPAGFVAARSLFPPDDIERGQVNFLRAGISHADALTTVSPTHAQEIQTPEFGMGLDALIRQRRHRLAGILNGVDYAHWSPESDALIAQHYSSHDLAGKRGCRAMLLHRLGLQADESTPVVGFVSRLAEQKGIDILIHALPALLAQHRLVFALLGSGERHYVEALRRLVARFPGRVAFLEAQDEPAAHGIIAGSDLLMMPSLYEPCGLTQLYAMRYGTVPVVRATGGLADTVRHFDPATGQGTGSVFRDADVGGLIWGLSAALGWFADRERWLQLVRNGMSQDFSWDRQGPKYEEIYARLAADA